MYIIIIRYSLKVVFFNTKHSHLERACMCVCVFFNYTHEFIN